uniref:Jacalin-type lectin domain-containing protein n=1 Tax=Globodera pallida TaxID=36090 RepID=A0A183BIV9_GLOPA
MPEARQIALNHQSPTDARGEDKNWIKKLGDELDKIGQKLGVTLLIEEVNERISNSGHLIAKKSNELCENLSEKRCREKERETRARLTVRELTILARRLVKYKILTLFFLEGNSGGPIRAKLNIWWYRFRYRVASAVTFDGNVSGSQIRLGIVQYYYGVHDELMELNIGAFGQAVGIEHRGVKVYDIEFHFGSEDGTLISDKMRRRGDTDRGVFVT